MSAELHDLWMTDPVVVQAAKLEGGSAPAAEAPAVEVADEPEPPAPLPKPAPAYPAAVQAYKELQEAHWRTCPECTGPKLHWICCYCGRLGSNASALPFNKPYYPAQVNTIDGVLISACSEAHYHEWTAALPQETPTTSRTEWDSY